MASARQKRRREPSPEPSAAPIAVESGDLAGSIRSVVKKLDSGCETDRVQACYSISNSLLRPTQNVAATDPSADLCTALLDAGVLGKLRMQLLSREVRVAALSAMRNLVYKGGSNVVTAIVVGELVQPLFSCFKEIARDIVKDNNAQDARMLEEVLEQWLPLMDQLCMDENPKVVEIVCSTDLPQTVYRLLTQAPAASVKEHIKILIGELILTILEYQPRAWSHIAGEPLPALVEKLTAIAKGSSSRGLRICGAALLHSLIATDPTKFADETLVTILSVLQDSSNFSLAAAWEGVQNSSVPSAENDGSDRAEALRKWRGDLYAMKMCWELGVNMTLLEDAERESVIPCRVFEQIGLQCLSQSLELAQRFFATSSSDDSSATLSANDRCTLSACIVAQVELLNNVILGISPEVWASAIAGTFENVQAAATMLSKRDGSTSDEADVTNAFVQLIWSILRVSRELGVDGFKDVRSELWKAVVSSVRSSATNVHVPEPFLGILCEAGRLVRNAQENWLFCKTMMDCVSKKQCSPNLLSEFADAFIDMYSSEEYDATYASLNVNAFLRGVVIPELETSLSENGADAMDTEGHEMPFDIERAEEVLQNLEAFAEYKGSAQ